MSSGVARRHVFPAPTAAGCDGLPPPTAPAIDLVGLAADPGLKDTETAAQVRHQEHACQAPTRRHATHSLSLH